MKNRSVLARPLCFFLLLPVCLSTPGLLFNVFATPARSEPWSQAQIISPADFVNELKQNHGASLKIIYVGVHALYVGAHIPGSIFHGPGSTDQGLADLKQYAATLPKDSNIVIYCGCCPLDRCPNLRPAFSTLKEMGFSQLRVLILPTSFAADWVDKGYPIEKGS